MIRHQLRGRGIRDARVLAAMQEVPREEFVDANLVEFAYDDTPLPIGQRQTISQPYVVALMVEQMSPQPGDRVLDIGTGSGYAAAVMSRIVGKVFSVERHRTLAEAAHRRVEALGMNNIEILRGDGIRGWPEHAPFDAINVAAGGAEVPEPLKEQLADGGRLVMPVGSPPMGQLLLRLVREGDDLRSEHLGLVSFVPLVSDTDDSGQLGTSGACGRSGAGPSESDPAQSRDT